MLGQKLDRIPFGPYRALMIVAPGLVGFADNYDLVMTGSLLVLAKEISERSLNTDGKSDAGRLASG